MPILALARCLTRAAIVMTAAAACGPSPRAGSPPPPPAEPAARELSVAAPSDVGQGPASAGPSSTSPAVASPSPASASFACVTAQPPRIRRGGDLVVESPPRRRAREAHLRMRSHVDGTLTTGNERVWVGPEVPPFVLLVGGTRELFLLDQAPDGFVGLYRDPYNLSSCQLVSSKNGDKNCSFGVALFDCSGHQRWLFLLDPLMSRPDQLEVQDIRYADGVLYFNEACQSYARNAGGKCSSLVAVEPLTKTVLWRTPPLVSNNVFLVHQRYLIAGHGFTDEPDFLFVVRRSDGKIMQKIPIPFAHEDLSIDAAEILSVAIEHDKILRFRVEGFDGDHPRLSPIPSPNPKDKGQGEWGGGKLRR